MADNVLGALFQEIADAIRTKTGGTDKMVPADFPERIAGIEDGEDPNVHYVTFMSQDGSEVLYKRPVADGDTCADPVAKGWVEMPVKESTAQYTYTYSGWASVANGSASSSILSAVTADKTVYAAFKSSVQYYTVSYYDGETLLKSESLAYGITPSYTPVKSGYEFNGWEPELAAVTGNAVYYSQWTELQGFAAASWAEIAEMAANGLASAAYSVGDYKTIDISGYGTVEVEIVGFDQDDLADGSGKAPITLALKNVMTGLTWSYVSTSHTSKTWVNSDLRSEISGLLSSLPSDLQKVIKPVSKVYKSNTSSGTATYATCTDSLWAFSNYELGLTSSGYTEGVIYTWYQTASGRAAKLKKTLYGDTTAQNYWLRSNTAWNRYWSYINTSGSSASQTYSGGYYIHFGFCI